MAWKDGQRAKRQCQQAAVRHTSHDQAPPSVFPMPMLGVLMCVQGH